MSTHQHTGRWPGVWLGLILAAMLSPTLAAQAAPLPSVAVGPDKTMSIIITYSPAKEQEVRAALATLKGLCTSLSARLR